MKKALLLLTVLYGHLYASDTQSTLKIYHKIFSALVDKEKIAIYTVDRELRDVFSHSKKIVLSNEPEYADIVLLTNSGVYSKVHKKLLSYNGSTKPILFSTHYRLLEESDDVVGAFYWRKGRSQLISLKNRLGKHNIHLPEKYKVFIVDGL